MADNRDIPHTHTIKPMDPPPDSSNPTTAMLKGDIDSGRTGAAGRPPSAFRVALARQYENAGRWMKGSRQTAAAHNKHDGIPVVFIGFIVAVGVILATGISIIR